MNHLKQIAARLPEYGLDAMLLNSEPGEYYAVGFHGEGNVVVTAQGCFYFTDSRYIEAANHLITGAEIAMTGRSRNYRAMVQEVVDRCRIRKLGFEEGYLSVADYNLWKEGLTAELVPAQKLVDALRAAKDDGEIALMTKAQEITDEAEVHRTKTISQVNAEVEQIRADISAQQEEATKKVNELLTDLNERREAANKQASELISSAQKTRDEAEAYASSKRDEADANAASILKQATEDADEQINERREAAKKELDGVQQRIADLQSREAQITQRVSELRAMFSNAFSGFGMNDLSVVNAVDEGEPSDAQSDDDAQHDDETAAPADADTQDAIENDSAAETEPEGDAESADASQNN